MSNFDVLTGVDEILVCQAWMVNIMNGGSKDGCHDFKRSEHRLKNNSKFIVASC